MMDAKTPDFRFDDVRIAPRAFRVWKAGHELALEPKAFKVLLYLIENRGRLVEKSELLDAVWKDTYVTENAMTREIAKLRKALGDDPKEARYIQTVHTRGYRFIAEVSEICAEPEEIITEDGTPTRLPIEPENADTPHRANENAQTSAASPSIAEKETVPLAVKELTPTSVVKSRALWLPLALVSGLLVIGALLFWFVKDRGGASETNTDENPVVVRTAQLTSWTGLDCYPSLTLDGNTIAFSSDRSGSFEIYLKQLVAGAREVQLTSDGGQNFQPAFSPDGSLIAYYSKKRGGIWVVPVTGGTSKQLTEFGSHPAWSPDGSLIAFQSDPLNDLGFNARNAMPPSVIWIVSAMGGDPQRLTQVGKPAGGHGAPAWSPDGKRIVFDTNDANSSAVWSVSAHGDDLKPISGDLEHAADAVYAPDGTDVLVIGTGREVWKIDVSETGDPLGEPVKIFDASGSRIRQLSIATTGKKIVYTALSTAGDIWATPIASNTNEATGDPVRLTHGRNIRNTGPAFSPDGKKIAYYSMLTGSESQLWMMDSDGKNQTQLTTAGGAYLPWWFPDGARIAFSSLRRENRAGLWSVAVEGRREKKIADFGGDASFARISPDGKQVAFNSKRSGTLNIWIVPIEGGQPVQLTFDKEFAGVPVWSPDGKWIAFQIKRGEDTHVAIMPSDGGEPVQLTFDKGQSWVYDFSPDGDKILFAGQRDDIWNIYWISLPTKQQKQVTNYTKLNSYVRYPAWSPLGKQIVYEYAETTGNIWVMDIK